MAVGLVLLLSGATALNVVDVGYASKSRLLPIENKDSFFSAPPNFYGVFDGVSQCPQSRAYSQTLAKVACAKLCEKGAVGSWSEQVTVAMREACVAAQDFSGASTALIMRMDLNQEQPQASWFNLGDCTGSLKGHTHPSRCRYSEV